MLNLGLNTPGFEEILQFIPPGCVNRVGVINVPLTIRFNGNLNDTGKLLRIPAGNRLTLGLISIGLNG